MHPLNSRKILRRIYLVPENILDSSGDLFVFQIDTETFFKRLDCFGFCLTSI
ncbi:hypothetical protein LEP1GSC048_0680 [Leptospira santarosai serovar Shermani str. 1342KT]|nr:hypothetical protein LEP1GSC048_0680 [Leptospira santarosai serovar Shermani str. 1342KT]